MDGGPTKGAHEVVRREWHASPVLARAIKVGAFLVPLLSAWLVVHGFSGKLYRPSGVRGILLWIAQAAVIGFIVSKLVERQTRRLLPLATLFNISLVFPDQAPSRFSIALRSGTARQLKRRLAEAADHGLGDSEEEAANHALALVTALGQHDRLTRGHTERVRAYSDMIAEELGMSQADRSMLAWGAMLHDVGKVKVPAEILNKDGRPSEAEWATLKKHPAESVAILAPLTDWLGDWLLAASEHHERWDGTGYPNGLAGREISLAGRITAVADAYDVITSKRSYKAPMSSEAARQELVRCAGSQFDPEVVRAFLNVSLGHKWATGPFAWLAEVPGFQLAGASSAAVPTVIPSLVSSTLAAVGAAALVVGATVGNMPPDTLAMIDTASIADSSSNETTTTISDDESSISISAGDTTTTSQTTAGPPPTDTTPSTSTTDPSDSGPTTTSTLTALTTSTTLTALPTTTGLPTTSAPLITLPITLPITTTTVVPTTTTTTASGGPTAVDDNATALPGVQKWIWAVANDDPGPNLLLDLGSLEIISPPSNADTYGVAGLGYIRYKSLGGFTGVDSLTYRICDYQSKCSTAVVTITVGP